MKHGCRTSLYQLDFEIFRTIYKKISSIKEFPEEILIKLAIVLKISKSS
jgi:hypothetical protein